MSLVRLLKKSSLSPFSRPLAGSMLIHALVVGGFMWAAWEWRVETAGQTTPAPGLMLVELVGESLESMGKAADASPEATPSSPSQVDDLPKVTASRPVETVVSPSVATDSMEPAAEPAGATAEAAVDGSEAGPASETAVVMPLGLADASPSGASARFVEDEAWNEFYAAVRSAIERAKRYPPSARRAGQEDRVTVSFLVLPDGQADELEVVGPSQYPILNRAAVETVQRVVRFPHPPASADRATRVIVPLVFVLHDEEN